MRKEPIVLSLKTNNQFPWDDYKFGRISKDEYPLTLVYEDIEEVTYDISNFKLERFWFEGTKELKPGYLYRELND